MGCCLCSRKPRVWGRWPTFVESGGTSEVFLLGLRQVLGRRGVRPWQQVIVVFPGGLDDRGVAVGRVCGQVGSQSEDLMHR